MRKYRIKEQLFKDNRSVFIPQFGEKSSIDGEYYYSDFYEYTETGTRKFLKFNTYGECVAEIRKDKQREEKPVCSRYYHLD